MLTQEGQKPKMHEMRTRVFVTADNSGTLPSRIEVLRAGMWPDASNKGMLYITNEDLLEMAANAKAGMGVPGGDITIGLPIDFMHEEWAEAAGWMKGFVVEDGILYADPVEWTTKGAEALRGGMFKCFSPSFYPKCLGEWCDPEDWNRTAVNVLVGGALTNIPFFKDLQPIMASRNSQEGNGRYQYFVAADSERSNMPTLEEVRVKAAADLSEEDKTLLAENKDKLNADERVKFGFETAEAPKVDAAATGAVETEEQKEAAKVQASIKAGTHVLVEANAYKALEGKVEAMDKQLTESREEKVKASVAQAVKEGKIVADQSDDWTKRIMADATMLEVMNKLSANPLLVKAAADNNRAEDEASGTDAFDTKVKKIMADAKEKGQELSYGDAVIRAAKADPEAAKAHERTMATV